ncbi:MAG: glycoside hydrolase family 31 protein [Micropruina sp.]|uniref:glycoside hydrolase family 31 protein n=1 Tax=Micropruina sp. TaxID=2737536 RepID=UPI0039E63A53
MTTRTDASTTIPLLTGELWWGGAVPDGGAMPFGRRPHRRDLAVNAGLVDDPTAGANQSAPLLLSSAGRAVWSERPFAFGFADGRLELDTPVELIETGGGLRDAYLAAARAFFPASGRLPARELFTAPQYNTWIEMPYRPTQDGVLAYAERLLAAGFPPGVLMLDDRWSTDYGDWRFDLYRFPDPAAMIGRLHRLGFQVMVWLVPFLSPDGDPFRELRKAGHLLRGADGEVLIREWWNGFSGLLDLTDPGAVAWLHARLGELRELGVDGFKLDAGDLRDYRLDDRPFGGGGPAELCEAFGRIGLEYPFNEYRACWKLGGQPLAQRLHDKPPTWGADGLLSLIPEGIAQGLIGHAFTCADMVGGGDVCTLGAGMPVEPEHFVRYTQVAALFPMVQFSISPARVLDDEHLALVHAALALRARLLPEIMELAEHAATTGEPIIRPLAYHHPGFEDVTDQFLLGEDLLVAPVLERGARTRRVVLPPGRWRRIDAGDDVHDAGFLELPVTLADQPVFRRER